MEHNDKVIEPEKVEPIINVTKKRKKSTGRVLFDAIFGNSIQELKDNFWTQILPDILRKGGHDLLQNVIDTTLGTGRSSRSSEDRTRFSSSSILSSSRSSSVRPRTTSNVYDYADYEIDDYGQANELRDAVIDYCKRYNNTISVARYYEFIGLLGNPTDAMWGWHDLNQNNVKIIEVSRGIWILKFPRPVPIN